MGNDGLNLRNKEVEEAYEKHGKALRLYAVKHYNRELVDDYLAEMWRLAVRSWDQFRGANGATRKTWLIRILVNVAKSQHRKVSNPKYLEVQFTHSEDVCEQDSNIELAVSPAFADTVEHRQLVRIILSSISPYHRGVVRKWMEKRTWSRDEAPLTTAEKLSVMRALLTVRKRLGVGPTV